MKVILDKEGGKSHINTLNNDELSPLDIAVLLENHSIVKILLKHGAVTGTEASEDVASHLNALLLSTEKKLHQLVNASTNSSGGVDSDKSYFDKRIKLLKKMLIGWQNLRIPDTPFSFSIGLLDIDNSGQFRVHNFLIFADVVGNNSALIKILQPIENYVCTQIKGK